MQSLLQSISTRYLATVFIITGIILRVREFLSGRSLWFDELLLALNIVDRNFIELLQPLDYNQGAPIGFLWTEKLLDTIFGNEDYILRIFPFAAAIAALFIFHKIATEILGKYAFLPLAFFAISDRLIYYSAETKQYSTDVFFNLAILLTFILWKKTKHDHRQALLYGLTGLIAAWYSHAAAFVLAATWLISAIKAVATRNNRKVAYLGIIGAVWTISFVVLYFLSLRDLSTNPGLIAHWQNNFAPAPPWEQTEWYRRAAEKLIRDLIRIPLLPTIIAISAGILSLAWRKTAVTATIIVTFTFTILASSLNLYPLQARLMLFAIPFTFLFIGEALRLIAVRLKFFNADTRVIATVIASVYLLFFPFMHSLESFIKPVMKEDIKPVLAHLSENFQEEDVVYVYYGAISAIHYYAPTYGFDVSNFYLGDWSRSDPAKYLDEISLLPDSPRTWFLFTHVCPVCTIDEQQFILDYLDENGNQIDAFSASFANGFLYDLNP